MRHTVTNTRGALIVSIDIHTVAGYRVQYQSAQPTSFDILTKYSERIHISSDDAGSASRIKLLINQLEQALVAAHTKKEKKNENAT